jgi:hypothetical protein
MRRLSPDGAIVVHDCSSPTEWHQRPAAAFVPGTDWNGTVWRALVRFRRMYPAIAVRTVDTDWGCAVIRPRDRESKRLRAIPAGFGWAGLERHRCEWLNLIFAGGLRGGDARRATQQVRNMKSGFRAAGAAEEVRHSPDR